MSLIYYETDPGKLAMANFLLRSMKTMPRQEYLVWLRAAGWTQMPLNKFQWVKLPGITEPHEERDALWTEIAVTLGI